MMWFLGESQKESIESLEFFYFLCEIDVSLLKKYRSSKNSLIQGFLRTVAEYKRWQVSRVNDYATALSDSVFWESSEFYLESIQKFVSGEYSGSEFVDMMFYRIIDDRKKALLLAKDFQKQTRVTINPKNFEFSKIIYDLKLVLITFDDEPEDGDSSYLTENQLREIVRTVLPKVERYFTD